MPSKSANMKYLLIGSILALLILLSILSLAFVINSRSGDIDRIAVISLSSDDGKLSDFTRVFPILKEYGINITVFVTVDSLGAKNRMNLSQITQLHSSGWEIGSHTMNHLDLTKVNSTTLVHEIADSKSYFEEHGLEVKSFAYPYGARNEAVSNIVKDYYVLARGVTSGGKSVGYIPNDLHDFSEIIAMPVPSDFGFMRGLIDMAIERHEWINFYFHSVTEEGKIDDSYSWNLSDLANHITKKTQSGLIKSMTLISAFNYYRNLLELQGSTQTLENLFVFANVNDICPRETEFYLSPTDFLELPPSCAVTAKKLVTQNGHSPAYFTREL